MRICDLCHGREFVAAYLICIWQPASEHPAGTEWDLCEECRSHVKESIHAVLNTKRGKAAAPEPAQPDKKPRRKAKQFEGAT